MARFISTLALVTITFFITNVLGIHIHYYRQSIPSVLPNPWTSKGCYLDVSPARTLAESSYISSDTMTVESCIAFCTTGGYHYAGVEYGRECFCDYAIQTQGITTTLDECNMACSGDASESCGAGNRINIYHDGIADAVVVETVSSWKYQGCYADNVDARILSQRINVSGGLTPSKCTASCKSNGFSYSGLEYSTECWCGDNLMSSNQVDGNECHMTCDGDRTKLCGGRSRITLYQDSNSEPQGPQTCQQTTVPTFNLRAVYKDTPESTISIKVIDVNTVPHVGYAILSVRFPLDRRLVSDSGLY
ncbi:WSC domain-containing protein [Collybia nuda]|uniref:WSC domain-containing protein n=1 Tax=Collybia nuda TaxID=64659 RepID=A0A9P5XXV2_9AGAR|nr:WSC domain-containing protein [Collybia nuda]